MTIQQTGPHPGGRLASVQALRGIAAMLVVLVHALQRQERLENPAHILSNGGYVGSIGVDLFFVISGFVMALSMQNYAGTKGAIVFARQRFLRIAPVFYLWALVFGALTLALQLWPIGWAHVANAVTILPVFDVGSYDFPVLGVGWTLAFEAVFYVLVMVGIVLRLPPWSLIAIIAGLALVPAPDWIEPVALRFAFNAIMLEFALGVLAYHLWSRNALNREFVATAAIIGVAVVTVFWPDAADPLYRSAPVYNNQLSEIRVLLWGVPCFFVFLAALDWEISSDVMARLAKTLGDASYSIYLTHPIILFGTPFTFLPGDLEVVAVVLICAVAGILAYRLIERPMLRALVPRPTVRKGLLNQA